jgi:hypothetical protein
VNGDTDRVALGSRAALVAIALLGAACTTSTPVGGGDGVWVGTITTEGDLTTVVNESGSVWGGPGGDRSLTARPSWRSSSTRPAPSW